jgi:hypothetical protein
MAAVGSPWTIIHRDHAGNSKGQTRPENLTFELNLNEPHTINYEVSFSDSITLPDVDGDFVGPYRTDFELYYGSVLIMAGLHTEHACNTDDEFAQVSGKDWSHYLEKRFWPFDPLNPTKYKLGRGAPPGYDPLNYPSGDDVYAAFQYDSGLVIKDLLDMTLGRMSVSSSLAQYSLNYTYPTLSAIGHLVNFQISANDTEPILSKIQQLSEEANGTFDWRVLPTKEIRLYVPHIYDAGAVDDPNACLWILDANDPPEKNGLMSIQFRNSGPAYTHLIGVSSNPQRGYSLGYTPGHKVFRRLDGQESFGDIPSKTRLYNLSQHALSHDLNPAHDVRITVMPDLFYIPESNIGFWDIFRPGEAIWVRADLKSHKLDSAQRITKMTCNVDTEGNSTVEFALEQLYDPGLPGDYEP